MGGERIAKALARAGVASRRDVERLIEAGRVALNGKVLTTPTVKVGYPATSSPSTAMWCRTPSPPACGATTSPWGW